jgi:hypothetical protein
MLEEGQHPMQSVTVAYLSQGKLYLKPPNEDALEITSQFVDSINDRNRKSSERQGWKNRASTQPEMLPAGMLWRTQQPAEMKNVKIGSVTRGAGNELLFTLNTNSVGGIFAHDPTDRSERRLYHKVGFRALHLSKHPTKDLVALAVHGEGMESHIALTDTAGRRLREVTEGECVDQCPSWMPGGAEKLVYQSAGIAKNAAGFEVAVGPSAVMQLDIAGGEMTTVLEDEQHDYLNPRMSAAGDLYFIRRPWTPNAKPTSIWRILSDTLLFPFRLIRAFIHFFNFFSIAFSGKPLISAGGPQQENQPMTSLMLWGKLIEADKILGKAREGELPSLVPQTWQLVRRDPSGNEHLLAKGVLSFDLTADGRIVYSNGSTVFCLNADEQPQSLCSGKLIEQVVALS